MLIVSIKRPKTRRQIFKRIIAVAAVVLLLTSVTATTVFAVLGMSKTAVCFDGEVVEVASFSEDPYKIVQKAGVQLGGNDSLDLSAYHEGSDGNLIIVDRAHEVIINDADKTPQVYIVSGTVGDALKKAGITLGEADEVSYDLSEKIEGNIAVVINRAFKVSVTVDGETKELSTAGGTVEQLLKKAGIELSENDTVNYDLNKKVSKKMKIKVNRVVYKTETQKVKLDFQKQSINTDQLYVGQSWTAQEGKAGEKTNYYNCKYVNGKLKEKKLVTSKVTVSPVNEVVYNGTRKYTVYKPSISSGIYAQKAAVKTTNTISELDAPHIELDSSGRPVKYKKLIVGEATAYSSGSVTAVGLPTLPGRVAVNPKQIPYGTKLYIVSCDGKYAYGYSQACDTGGFVDTSNAIADLYFNSESDAIQFGRRQVEIYVLE